ncbi:ATP-binding cassette domain-containing protein [Dictyobacter aurantiacus]|uniref:ABC transporter ATP-binding protein n=1 Tax=Dictyobacter aurantiacus TaxID=1936993 RepID=A0A401ZG55_9CHLR|nr:ATP-binding cassette domain-containing protein [Dictyobacter aurantiacus]GCE05855.1 ABC transporter ATP-binding protein [Dictyobacter aurantiacus]
MIQKQDASSSALSPPVAPIIKVERLVKRYKKAETNAVNEISFSVRPGSLFSLLGPNGAGKTTTISILTTTLQPTSGSVMIADYDISRQASAVRKNIGIIFQKPSLDLNLTAEENVRFHATLYGLYPFRPSYKTMPKGYQQRIDELANVLEIREDLFKPVKKFSGGMMRKLEILRSLLHNPRVLFLDEPTTGLDPSSRRSLWEYLSKVRLEQQTTIFLTTHYLEEAEKADDICIINKGNIVAHGTPAQVKAELVEEYVLLDADDRASLLAELRRLDLSVGEQVPFKVSLAHDRLHSVLKAIETPLTLIETHLPSLEDAYMEIIGK